MHFKIQKKQFKMSVSGIKIERNYKGVPTYARIDMKKYGNQLMVFFNENGIDLSDVGIGGIPRGSMSIEDARKSLLQIVDDLCDKYGID